MASTATDATGRVLHVRAGKALTLSIAAKTDTSPRTEIDLSAYTGRLQVRDLRGKGRVLLDTKDSELITAPLQRLSVGTWRVFLGKTYTSWFPMLAQIEIEIENTTNPEDVQSLFSGTLSITPEAVVN